MIKNKLTDLTNMLKSNSAFHSIKIFLKIFSLTRKLFSKTYRLKLSLIFTAFFTVAFFFGAPFSCSCESIPIITNITTNITTNGITGSVEVSRWLESRYNTNRVTNDLTSEVYQHLQSAAAQTTPIDSLKDDIFIWLDTSENIYMDILNQNNVLQWRNKKQRIYHIVATNVDTIVITSSNTAFEIIEEELVGITNITRTENIVKSIVLSSNVPSAMPKSDLGNKYLVRNSSSSAIIVDYEGDDRVGFAVDTSAMDETHTISAFYLVTKTIGGNGNYHIPLGYDNLQIGKRFFSKKDGSLEYDFSSGNEGKGNIFVGENSYRSSDSRHSISSTIALYSRTNLDISKTDLNGILGTFPTTADQGGEEHISELIIFTNDTNDDEHSNVVKYLIEKWHIPRNRVTSGFYSEFDSVSSHVIQNAFDSNRNTIFYLSNSSQNSFTDGMVLLEHRIYDSVLEPQSVEYLSRSIGYSTGVKSLHLRTGYSSRYRSLFAGARVEIFRSNDLSWYTLTNIAANNSVRSKEFYFYLLDPSNDFLMYRLVATGSGSAPHLLNIDDFVPSSASANSPRILSFINTLPNTAEVRDSDFFAFEVGFSNYLNFDQDVFDLNNDDFIINHGSIVSVESVGTGSSNYLVRIQASSNALNSYSDFVSGLSVVLRQDAVTNASGEVNIVFNNNWSLVLSDPFEGFGSGLQRSAPNFGDIDGDGDLDMLSGNSTGEFIYYSNQGDGSFVEYKNVDDNPFKDFDVGQYSTPTFADIDGDGKLDMISGRGNSFFYYYSNSGDGSFVEYQNVDTNPFKGLYNEAYSKPSLDDIDGDEDVDMIYGDTTGIFIYLSNRGDGSFVQYKNVDENPLKDFNALNYSAPALGDIDGDGDLDMLSGNYTGEFIYYSNQGDGSFVEYRNVDDNPFNDFDTGDYDQYSSPSLGDVDGDGDLDMLSGRKNGDFVYYKNIGGVYVEVE